MNISTLSSAHESLLTALAASDPAAWCFLATDPQSPLAASHEFVAQWNLESGSAGLNLLNRSTLAQSFSGQGIDAEQFFRFVAESGSSIRSLHLVRSDSKRINATITPVASGPVLVGHLVRFREAVDANVIETILREIAFAKRRLDVLSSREKEILDLVFEGRTNKAISIATSISEKTVEKHRARIMQKLNLNCTAELFRLVSKASLMSHRDPMSSTSNNGTTAPSNLVPPPNFPFSNIVKPSTDLPRSM
ncbi:MAG: helix-turn-helix transcriptional regulator [Planctomycetaceae bacterium]